MNKKWLLILLGLSGTTALVYEIVWIRPLSLVFGTTIYAVSTIIASFIFGLALGSWIAGKYTDRLKNPLRYFAFIQVGIGLYGILLLPVFANLSWFYLDIYFLTFPNQSAFFFIQILLSMGILLIPTTMMGTTLPLMMRTYSKEFSTIGKDVGKLDASNSFGAVAGTLVAGFAMIPLLGIQNSILIIALVNIGIGLAILTLKKYLNYRYIGLVVILVIGIFLLIPSYDVKTLNLGVYAYIYPDYSKDNAKSIVESENILFYKESLYSTVIVANDSSGYLGLKINGKSQCATIPAVVEGLERLAAVPYDFFEYNYGKPKNALNIGLGCGVTSKWLSERVDTTTVEIDPVVVESSKMFYDNIDHDLIIDDARNWLLRNDKKFDLITLQPSDPYENHGSLFTKEFFSLLSNRVSENGLVSQWVPSYLLSEEEGNIFFNTFNSVFPHIYIIALQDVGFRNEHIFIGSQKPLEIQEGIEYLDGKDAPVSDTVLNTDDRNVLEFKTALNLYELRQ